MSEELQKPPVIDLEAMLQPISEENPSGEYLLYTDIYDQLREARRSDKNLSQGEWKTELKIADFRQVISLAVPALTTQTKDLQISVWLAEALTNEHGFAGLRDSLKLIGGLQANFWETLHPEIDEGDMEGRANAISWMETDPFILVVKGMKFTGGDGYSFLDWDDSKRFDIPDNLDTLSSADQQRYRDLQTQAETERRVTGAMWRKDKAATRRAFCEETNFVMEECWAAFNDLNRVIEEKFDRNQMPGLSRLKKTLEDIHFQVKTLLEEKRLEEPDEVEAVEEAESSVGGDGLIVGAQGSITTPTGAIQSRKDALKRLSDLADFFQKTEPHSPISYLVARAVKWGNMPLESWLQDVIKDDSVLSSLRQTLGFNTGNDDGTAS
ncbi:MAG: type VI secretion system protein TssA [Acidobacteriota bacterium]|nr:type VI secretion system protein TssA [Acidobacteriota bacterium]